MQIAGWPTGNVNAGQAPEPSAMMEPGRVRGWPNGTQVGGNAATNLLAQAVGWWDASLYRPGDRFLRNRGTGRELLDLRLGSSFEANSNDPQFLAPEDRGYVYLPGGSANRLQVPDEAALDITGDIDLRALVALDNWTPSAISPIINKLSSTGNQRSYRLSVGTNGTLVFAYWPDGVTAAARVSTASAGLGIGTIKWVRVTLDADNGASGHDVSFYLSDDCVTWTQLGATVTTAGVASIFASSAVLEIGSTSSAGQALTGKVYAAQVWDGIEGSGGTKVLDIDCDAITSGSATSFTAVTNQTVTVNRSTSGRKAVAMPSRWNNGRACFLFGTDDYMEVQDAWQHQMLNFAGGDSFTVLAVVRQWGTVASGATLIGKADSNARSVAAPRWNMRYGASNTAFGQLDDGSTYSETTSVTVSLGAVSVVAMTVTNGDARTSLGSTLAASVARASRGLVNRSPVQISRFAATGFADYEFLAAAIFRRALTADEIALITRHYTGA